MPFLFLNFCMWPLHSCLELLRSSFYIFYSKILQWSASGGPLFSHCAKYSVHILNVEFMLFMFWKNSLIISSSLFSLCISSIGSVFDPLDWSSNSLTCFSCCPSLAIFVLLSARVPQPYLPTFLLKFLF